MLNYSKFYDSSGIFKTTKLHEALYELGFDLGGLGIRERYNIYTKASLDAISKVNNLSKSKNDVLMKIKDYINELHKTGRYKDKEKVLNTYKEILNNIPLSQGDRGIAVIQLQRKLERLGFLISPYGEIGLYGSITKEIISIIQKFRGIRSTGKYDGKTIILLSGIIDEYDEKKDFYRSDGMLQAYDKYRNGKATKDVPLNIRGQYIGKIIYYSQKDKRWNKESYKPSGTMGEASCAPTSMAMVLSTLLNRTILPIETAKYAMRNGYVVEAGTVDSYFKVIAKEYGINYVGGYGTKALRKVKESLAKGNCLVIAWMNPIHFTSEGHYLVLTGIDCIDKQEYFTVYEPNYPNNNFDLVDYDGIIIESEEDKYVIKASTKIFAGECRKYHIFSR